MFFSRREVNVTGSFIRESVPGYVLLRIVTNCYVLSRIVTYCYVLLCIATYCYVLLRIVTYRQKNVLFFSRRDVGEVIRNVTPLLYVKDSSEHTQSCRVFWVNKAGRAIDRCESLCCCSVI